MRKIACFVLASTSAIAGAAFAEDLPRRPVMTLSAAQAAVQGCVSIAAREGWKMNIAVLDNAANVKALVRMDDALLGMQELALSKASTAAKTGSSTADSAKFAFGANGPQPLAMQSGFVFATGGLPIKTADGHLIGSIGVSGSSPANDEACAKAGIEAIQASLK